MNSSLIRSLTVVVIVPPVVPLLVQDSLLNRPWFNDLSLYNFDLLGLGCLNQLPSNLAHSVHLSIELYTPTPAPFGLQPCPW